MSMTTESLNSSQRGISKKAEQDAREIAKEYGVKVRKSHVRGIVVTFPDGEKNRYFGWIHLQNELVKMFDLAD